MPPTHPPTEARKEARPMTSQIGMMNVNSVALASDSAGTWSIADQSYNTAEKIFQLAGRQPVGFMTYGDGGYMGIRWDRILGMYRERIGTREKDGKGKIIPGSVKELNWLTSTEKPEDPGYVEDFIAHLDSLTDESMFVQEKLSMYREIAGYIESQIFQFKALKTHVETVTNQDIYTPAPSKIVTAIVERQDKLWKQFSELFEEHLIGFSSELYGKLDPNGKSECDRVVLEEGDEIVKALCKHYRPSLYRKKISRKLRGALGKIVGCYIAEKMWEGENVPGGAGMVIAGFGREEEFPTMVELYIRSKWGNKMRYSVKKKLAEECVVPFAQADQIRTVINGISPNVFARIERNLWDELPELIHHIASATGGVGPVTRSKLLGTLARSPGIPPLMLKHLLSPADSEEERGRNIGSLDIMRLAHDDLAALAEKLVDLESTIQYVHYGLGAQVGGEIDVASITKEDGLIWVKRKSKIDRELNPRVFKQPRDRARHI